VLILCNKQDVQDAISKEEFENIFAASGLSQTIQQWKIVNTSALYGKGHFSLLISNTFLKEMLNILVTIRDK